jgi:hypothetical protein
MLSWRNGLRSSLRDWIIAGSNPVGSIKTSGCSAVGSAAVSGTAGRRYSFSFGDALRTENASRTNPATQTFLAPVAQSEEVPHLECGGYWFKASQGYWCDAGEVARVGLEVS